MSKAVRVAVLIGAVMLLWVGVVPADTVSISPYKIILNAQGQAESILAIMPMSLGGYQFDSGEATLSLNGETVATTVDMRYCYIDDNLLIYFDRAQLLAHPTVIALAGSTVTATVTGSFTAVNADGESYSRDFEASDQVEILAPGKTGGNAK